MNLCNLWKKNYSVCRECGVHFEPVTGADARWGYLCATHRAPAIKDDFERDAVMAWTKDNLPKVKKLMDECINCNLPPKIEEWEKDEALRRMTRSNLYGQVSGLSGQKPGSLYGHHER